MKISRPVLAVAAALLVLSTLTAPAPAGAQPQAGVASAAGGEEAPPLPWVGEERVEVELRTVPFYAVDGHGRPVYDLRPEEVRIAVGGEPVPLDTFDRFATSAGPPPAAEGGATAPQPPPLPRHVLFLFDQAFSSPEALARSRRAAVQLLDRLPAADRLYLLTNHSQTGLRQELGPVGADASGKAAVRERIDALLPNVERLRTRAEADLPSLSVGADVGHGIPEQQAHNFYDFIGGMGRTEYRAAAEDLAGGLEVLAAQLRKLRGVKLLLFFSGGVNSRMYFEGDYAGEGLGSRWTAGSSGMYHVDQRRFGPIYYRFEEPLSRLAAAGTMAVFVNPAEDATTERSSVHHMSEVTGGLYLGNRDMRFIEERLLGSTSAYYEAGFYIDEGVAIDETAAVEIEVLRPGVTAWSPRRLQHRRTYRHLGSDEREYFIVDLVARGIGEGAQPAAAAAVQQLAGRVGGRAVQGGRQLVFEAGRPAGLGKEELDLYNVVVRVRHDAEPELVRLDRQQLAPGGGVIRASTSLPDDGAYIWGIVAVEPASGATYFRRLLLEAPAARAGRAGEEDLP